MKKVELKNAKEKFAKARELCPGMEEELYTMTDYLATIIKDTLIPARLILTVSNIENAIKKGKNNYKGKTFPEFFIKNFGTNSQESEDYPEYAKVAAEYWANSLQTRNFNNGDELTSIFAMAIAGSKREYTEAELKIFKESLAEDVYEKVETYGNCTVDVDYGPCYILAKAGKLIDVDPFDYSWKTSMIVTKEKVTVRDGYGADRRILYQKTSDINPKELKK